MTGDNYTSDCFRTLQSAVKTAGAIAVSRPLAYNVMLWFFQLFYLEPSGPLHTRIFSYCDAVVADVASGCSVIEQSSLTHLLSGLWKNLYFCLV